MKDPTPHLERFESYEKACREFRWLIPERFNIASAICRRHPDAVTRVALTEVREAGLNTYTFGALDFLSDKFATALVDSGISQGDSVAILLTQSAAWAIAQFATLKCGAVVVPLPINADPALVRHTLTDSSARAVVVEESIFGIVEPFTCELPNLGSCFVARDLRPPAMGPEFKDFWTEVDRASSDFEAADTTADSDAFIFYPASQPEPGIVHSHRSVVGQLSSFEMVYNGDHDAGSVFWTADEWPSTGAALGVLYPAWWHGCSVVAGSLEDSQDALGMMERCEVTHFFTSGSRPSGPVEPDHKCFDLAVRTVVSERSRWREYWSTNHPGVTWNEVYGKRETGWTVGGCPRWFSTSAGSVGRPVPGRLIEIIDESGNMLPPNQSGLIAIHKSDPGLFTRYHNAPERTAASFIGEWFLTGDQGYKSENGDLCVPRYVLG